MLNKSTILKDFKDTIFKSLLTTDNKEIQKIIDNHYKKLKITISDTNDHLLLFYCKMIISLEYRYKCHSYDYMAFSRRMGEFWEPFCAIAFSGVQSIKPPKYSQIKKENISNFKNMIGPDKDLILQSYMQLWNILDSGNINLSLDLHIKHDSQTYHIDFKTGFSSNEKGNTTRLLQVGSLYKYTEPNSKCLLLVRSVNNANYLQTILNSGLWTVYTGSLAYQFIKDITGYDLQKFINENVDILSDVCPDFSKFITDNNLQQYCKW